MKWQLNPNMFFFNEDFSGIGSIVERRGVDTKSECGNGSTQPITKVLGTTLISRILLSIFGICVFGFLRKSARKNKQY